jgi:cytochrome c
MVKVIAASMSLVLALLATGAAAQSGDAAQGERLFNQQCKACHTIDKGARNGVGPNLNGMFDRKAGTLAGFAYSDAMAKSGITWSDKTVADYLKDPKAVVPSGKMAFAGLKQEAQLANMIAYLRKATQ